MRSSQSDSDPSTHREGVESWDKFVTTLHLWTGDIRCPEHRNVLGRQQPGPGSEQAWGRSVAVLIPLPAKLPAERAEHRELGRSVMLFGIFHLKRIPTLSEHLQGFRVFVFAT